MAFEEHDGKRDSTKIQGFDKFIDLTIARIYFDEKSESGEIKKRKLLTVNTGGTQAYLYEITQNTISWIECILVQGVVKRNGITHKGISIASEGLSKLLGFNIADLTERFEKLYNEHHPA